jgi:Zn-dependent protease/predicted transcriptional regulator
MMPASVRLGRIAGIPVALHYSWFIIAALITFSLANHFRSTQADWDPRLVWTTAVLTALLFFATLLAHELSHALVAAARKLPVRSITLFALGGITQIDKGANSAKTEFLVGIVGPLTSCAVGLLCLAAAWSLGWSPESGASGPTSAVLGWLGSINLLLAAFNLLPAYPLDGGRVLRATLWGVYKSSERATRHASTVGQVFAGLFIVVGLYQFLVAASFGGLWLAFIGWFLLSAAQAEYAQVTVSDALRGVRVVDLMGQDCAFVAADTNLRAVVDDVLLKSGRRCVMVQSDGHVLVLLTTNEVRSVEPARWPEVSARDVMRPLHKLKTVTPETPVMEAITIMTREDVNQLPVISRGRLEGLISRARILHLLQSRSELNA